MPEKILITGAAGFIGFHLSKRLMDEGYQVTGLDNLNDYYDINLKNARLEILLEDKNFNFEKIDLGERDKIQRLFILQKFDYSIYYKTFQQFSTYSLAIFSRMNISGIVKSFIGIRLIKIR